MRLRALLLASGLAVGATSAAGAAATLPHAAVSLQGLDKVTARVGPLTATVGATMRFGRLAILPRACFTAPPTEPPESAAFLEIREVDADGKAELVFSGWMFASSPGLSALEHPVYDVWVLTCDGPLVPELAPETPSTTQRPNG